MLFSFALTLVLWCHSEMSVFISLGNLCIHRHLCSSYNSNMTSFFRFVNKRVIYRLGIISLEHAPVHLTDFPVVNVHVNELSSARMWQHKLCATLSSNVNININYRLPIKEYYRICTVRHIRIGIIHGSQNVFWVLTWVGRILVNFSLATVRDKILISANQC